MATLYDLTEELTALLEDMEMWAEDHAGDITDYPLERIEKLEGEVKDKVLRVACFVKDLKAEAKAIKAEEEALAKREASRKNKAARLVKYLEGCVPENAKFKSALAEVSWAKNPAAVEVLVPKEIIPELYLVRPAPEVSKEKLKVAMLPYQVPVIDSLGAPVLGPDEKPLMREEMQVRWPLPTGETRKESVWNETLQDREDVEEDILAEKPIARLVQGKRISIK